MAQRGRPKMTSESTEKLIHLRLVVTEKELEMIHHACAKKRMTQGEFDRWAVLTAAAEIVSEIDKSKIVIPYAPLAHAP
jgi:hypothetical protein